MNTKLSKYIDAKNRILRFLKYIVKKNRSKKDAEEYKIAVIDEILPLIFMLRPDLDKKTDAFLNDYKSQRNKLENLSIEQIKKAYSILKLRVTQRNLWENIEIKRIICSIEAILQFKPDDRDAVEVKNVDGNTDFICNLCGDSKINHRIFVFPSYVEGLFMKVCNFCDILHKQGHNDLIKDLVVFKKTIVDQELSPFRKYYCFECKYVYNKNSALRDNNGQIIAFDDLDDGWACPKCSVDKSEFFPIYPGYIAHKVFKISRYKFAPAFFKLSNFDRKFNFYKQSPKLEIALFNIFCLTETITEERRSYLRKREKKPLHFNNHQKIAENSYLLLLNLQRTELKPKAEAKKLEDRTVVHGRKWIDNNLDSILEEAYKDYKKNNKSYKPVYPESLELFLTDERELRLKIGWDCDIIQTVEIQKFHGESNVIFNFVDMLIQNPGVPQSFQYDLKVAAKLNAKTYLNKIGLEGILYKLFITNKDGSSVYFNSKCINIRDKNLSKEELEEIVLHLGGLSHIDWEINDPKFFI